MGTQVAALPVGSTLAPPIAVEGGDAPFGRYCIVSGPLRGKEVEPRYTPMLGWYTSLDGAAKPLTPEQKAEIMRRSAITFPDDMPLKQRMMLRNERVYPDLWQETYGDTPYSPEQVPLILGAEVWDHRSGVTIRKEGATLVSVSYKVVGGREGERAAMIVGVVFEHPEFGPCFFHRFKGMQYHDNTRCPSPVDTICASWLYAAGIKVLYAYDAENQILWKCAIDDLLSAPIVAFTAKLARHRYMLSEENWSNLVGVVEGNGVNRAKRYNHQRKTLFSVPWVGGNPVVLKFRGM